MFKLERRERPGDRSRRRIATPSESVEPAFKNGMVIVSVQSKSTAKLLQTRRFGFRMRAPASAPTPRQTVKPSLADMPAPTDESAVSEVLAMSKTARKKLASQLDIEGRSKMTDEQLARAIAKLRS